MCSQDEKHAQKNVFGEPLEDCSQILRLVGIEMDVVIQMIKIAVITLSVLKLLMNFCLGLKRLGMI